MMSSGFCEFTLGDEFYCFLRFLFKEKNLMDMFFHVKIQLQKFSDCDMDLTYIHGGLMKIKAHFRQGSRVQFPRTQFGPI